MDAYRDTAAQASAGRTNAAAAQQRAQTAAAEAEALVAQVRTRKQDLSGQIAQVRGALADLPAADKAEIGQVQDNGSYLGPPGAANDALQAALSKRGAEYEWAATGPNEFDCSGLTSWAYKQAGIAIPRTSRQQYTAGKAVSLDALQPGDLLFYDDGTGDPGAIHHVGMFVGAGKMVDAPTEGQLVDVRSMRGDEPMRVRDVLGDLNTRRDLAYTTVMTVLDNLHRKAWVARDRDGRAYRYWPLVGRQEAAAHALRRVLDSTGDPEGVLLHFAQTASEAESDILRKALRRKPRKR
ncbi:NlpC/P60 family protein [Amycolatopsis antarctica]|nr:NlpC/P60 family protein [Amycolatopsis antarctica]